MGSEEIAVLRPAFHLSQFSLADSTERASSEELILYIIYFLILIACLLKSQVGAINNSGVVTKHCLCMGLQCHIAPTTSARDTIHPITSEGSCYFTI